MKISFEPSALRTTQWTQYMLRFALGGIVTLLAGLIAKGFGPVVGGLFLAFPAIFPAGATLISRQECEKKRKAGFDCGRRGHRVAALDAAGAILGSVGLFFFAVGFWWSTLHGAATAFLLAPFLWASLSFSLWWWRKRHRWNDRRPTSLDGSRQEPAVSADVVGPDER